MAREVRVAIIGDPSSLQRALRTADTGVTRFGQRMQSFGTRMRSFGASMSRNLTLPLVGFGVLAARELSESQRVMGQTEAVIRSMGIAAQVSAEDVAAMAVEMRDMSGMDDEGLQEMINTLLTFREVVPVFDEASAAAQDMAAFFGSDLQTAATQVGRALNNPLRGLTALTRRGVEFTESQVAAVEAMMAVGDVAGAQQVILEELRAEYGGQAEALGDTLGGRLNIIKQKMEDLGASILEDLMPALEDLAGMLSAVADGYSGLTGTQQKWVAGMVAALAVAGPLASAVGALASVIGWLIPIVTTLAGVLVTPIVAVGLLAAAVGGGAIYIATHWRETTDFLRNAWNNTLGVARAVWANISGAIRSAATSAASAVGRAVDDMMGFIRSIPGRAGAIASSFGGVLVGAGRAIIQGLWDGMQAVWGSVTSWLSGLADIIPDWKGPMEKDRKILIPTGRVIMEGLGAGMRQGWDEDVTPFLRSATADTGRFIPRRGRQQQASSNGLGDPVEFAKAVGREIRKGVPVWAMD